MEKETILLFRLEGVLQSWGEWGKWDYRDTSSFPTKSGVVGMIACALGLQRNDPQIGTLSDKLTLAIRADRQGELLTDYHTVQADVLMTAEGKKRSGSSSTIVSHRNYLQDASFLIALSGDKNLLFHLSDAMKHPVWTMYLGRKSCIPSVPIQGIVTEEYTDVRDALQKYPLTERHDRDILIEYESQDFGEMVKVDRRIADVNRMYGTRYISHEIYQGGEL